MLEASPKQFVASALALMTKSSIHRDWSVADLERLLFPPAYLGQGWLFADPSRKQIVSFATWANFDEEAEAAFITGHRKLQPEDWYSGDYSRIWIIDAVAPYGDILQTGRWIKKFLLDRATKEGWPARRARWKRRYYGRDREEKIGEVHGRTDA